MHNEDGGSIQVTNLISSPGLDQYQIEIAIGTHLYHFPIRFSELRELFKDIKCDNAKFPSRCPITSTFLPLLRPARREQFRRTRLEELTCFFSAISRGLTLKNYPQFWVLFERAKTWENSLMLLKRPKPSSLGRLLAQNRNKLIYVTAC